MTPREHAAYSAGIEAVRQAALTAAITIEVRDDARDVRQQAAIAALRGLADGARAMTLADHSNAASGDTPSPNRSTP